MAGDPPPITLQRGTADVGAGLKGSPIQMQQLEKCIWSPYPAAFVAVYRDREDAQVWDAANAKKVGRPLKDLPYAHKHALSPDGQHLAMLVVEGQKSNIEVWSAERGGRAAQWQFADKSRYSDVVMFAGPDKLLVFSGESKGTAIQIFSLKGEKLGQIDAPAHLVEKAYAVSPDGRRLAVYASIYNDKAIVYDLATQTSVAEFPRSGSSGNCGGLAFSADGQELAGLFTGGSRGTRLVSWTPDNREVVTDFVTTAASLGLKGATSYQGEAIQWLPDRSGWLLMGHFVVDRASEQVVWMFRSGDDDFLPSGRRFLDSDRLALFAGPRASQRLQIAGVPWQKIDASLQALAADAPAHVKPGQAMTLEIEMGQLRAGTVEATRDVLAGAITRGLRERGMDLDDDQPVVLALRYQEEEGNELEELQSRTPGGIPVPGPFARGTGRTLKATHIVCDLALKVDGKTQWSSHIDLDPTMLSIRGDFSDAAAREASLNMVAAYLAQQSFPYFLPQDENLSPLPGVTVLPSGAGSRPGVKVKPGAKDAPRSTPPGRRVPTNRI